MPSYTQERTHTYTLKPDRDTVTLTGSEDYRITVLSGTAHVSFSDGEIKQVDKKDGLRIDGRKGEHNIFSSTGATVYVWHGIPDHPNSGVSRTPFPGDVEHPLERQDDPEPKGPPAVLKPRSAGGDPHEVAPAAEKQQPQSKSNRLKTGNPRLVKDLPEVHSVPTAKQTRRGKPKTRVTARPRTRKSKEIKQAAKPSARTGTGAKSPSKSAGSTRRHTGETGRTQTKREARRTEPKPNTRKARSGNKATKRERKR